MGYNNLCEVVLLKISRKENNLIEVLLREPNATTASQIAEELGVSNKTVYRLIKKINELVPGKEVIETKTNKGISLNYQNYLNFSHGVVSDERTADDRRNQIILELLFRSPKKILIEDLYKDEYVSNELIYKDIEKMRELLAKNNLILEKTGPYLSIEGSEKDIRNISYTLISVNSFLSSETYNVNNKTVNRYDTNFITSLLEKVEKEIENSIPYPYNINIYSHLYILISRIRNGIIQTTDTSLQSLDKSEQALIDKNQDKWILANKTLEQIANYTGSIIPENEAIYLFQHFLSIRNQSDEPKILTGVEKSTTEKAFDYLIKTLQEYVSFSKQNLPLSELLNHFELMLYRSENGIIIKNEMFRDITREYSELYEALIISIKRMIKKFKLPKVTEDEVSFLTLYFAQGIEREGKPKRVLIMCSSGVGTSELLKVKIQKFFPNLIIVDVVSYNQYKKFYKQDWEEKFDLLLTTVMLAEECACPNLLVNFMFTKMDQQNVAKLLEEL